VFHFSTKLLEGANRVPRFFQHQSEQSCWPATAQLITHSQHYFSARQALEQHGSGTAKLSPKIVPSVPARGCICDAQQ
jgi:hypothetical protein